MYTTDIQYYHTENGRTFGDLGWFPEDTETETLEESIRYARIGAPELDEANNDYASGIIAVYRIQEGGRAGAVVYTLAFCTKEDGAEFGIEADEYLMKRQGA